MGHTMTTLTNGYRSLSLIVNLNWDRLFYLAAIFGALMGGALIGSLIS